MLFKDTDYHLKQQMKIGKVNHEKSSGFKSKTGDMIQKVNTRLFYVTSVTSVTCAVNQFINLLQGCNKCNRVVTEVT